MLHHIRARRKQDLIRSIIYLSAVLALSLWEGIAVDLGDQKIYAQTELRGKIVDASTGLPVTDVLLYLGNGEIVPCADGMFDLSGQAVGSSLTVKAPGYRKTHIPITDQSSLDILLDPFQARGIYVPFGLLALPDRVKTLIEKVAQTELNCIVVDVKSDRGFISFDSQVPLVSTIGAHRRGFLNPEKVLRWCEEKDIYTIARMVVFKDNPLAHGKPEWAVVDADDQIWLDREQLGWANPFREEVWDYNIALAKEVAEMGFDEIQLDYIRFPSDGDVKAILYEEENTLETRSAAIRGFSEKFEQELLPYGVFTSADVFGLTVWVKEGSDMGIGQRVEDVSPHVDYLCPMVYPSTFESGNLGYANPNIHPYGVVYRSTLQSLERSHAKVRPWLQHYSLGGVVYDFQRLFAQKSAANAVVPYGAQGWTYWNAGGKYDFNLFSPAPTN